MARWLLSAHNPRESLGVSYPITATWFTEFSGRQLEYVIAPLVGGRGPLDLSLPTMVAVDSQAFINISCMSRNVGLVVPFDPASLGAPATAAQPERRPQLSTQLLLPFRFVGVYRKGMQTYREVVARYKETLLDVFWKMHARGSGQLGDQDLAQVWRLFEKPMLDLAVAYANIIVFIAMLNVGMVGWVAKKAPALLNLLVGRGTATALLADRIWELRDIAIHCGDKVVGLLRRGETDLAAYEAVPEAAPLVEAVQRFMRTYGHRAYHYALEFEATRLADQPSLVLLALAGLLEENEPPSVRAESARTVSLRVLRAMNPPRRFLWKSLLRFGSSLVEQREEIRNILELQNATYGLAARQLSRYYFPSCPADHLFLYTFEEFLAFGQSQGQKRVAPDEVERRRGDLAEHRSRPLLPELIWYDPATREWWPAQEGQTDTSAARLQGIGVSAGGGAVEGVALVTDSAEEAAKRLIGMTGPVVLVTHLTDPVWSSLFRRLTAVVTEMGGMISHAAIVARECGVPAVVGVSQAASLIPDGQWVRVDGAEGIVEMIEPGQGSGQQPTTPLVDPRACRETTRGRGRD